MLVTRWSRVVSIELIDSSRDAARGGIDFSLSTRARSRTRNKRAAGERTRMKWICTKQPNIFQQIIRASESQRWRRRRAKKGRSTAGYDRLANVGFLVPCNDKCVLAGSIERLVGRGLGHNGKSISSRKCLLFERSVQVPRAAFEKENWNEMFFPRNCQSKYLLISSFVESFSNS